MRTVRASPRILLVHAGPRRLDGSFDRQQVRRCCFAHRVSVLARRPHTARSYTTYAKRNASPSPLPLRPLLSSSEAHRLVWPPEDQISLSQLSAGNFLSRSLLKPPSKAPYVLVDDLTCWRRKKHSNASWRAPPLASSSPALQR